MDTSTQDNVSVFLSTEEAARLTEQFQINQDILDRDRQVFQRKIDEIQEKHSQLRAQKLQMDTDLKEFQSKIDLYIPQISTMLTKQKGHYQKDQKIQTMYQRFQKLESSVRSPSRSDKVKSSPFLNFEDMNDNLQMRYDEEENYKAVEKILQTDTGLSQAQKTMLKDALAMYMSESEVYEKNQSQLDGLVRSSFENREHVLRKEAKLLAIQYCVHCKQRFSPLSNQDGDCVFHVGKLKFYSCKACGCDEYYNCCGKCLKCCKGCGKGKHAAKEKVYRHDTSPFTHPRTLSLKEIGGDQSFYELTLESINFSTQKA